MIYTVIEWVYYVCCMVCMVCVGEWTFRWTVKDWKRFVAAGVIYIGGFLCNWLQEYSEFPFFMLFYAGEIGAWMLICKGSIRSRLFKILILFFGLGVIETGFKVLVEMVLGEQLGKELSKLCAILLMLAVCAAITQQRWYKRLIGYLQTLPKRRAVLILGAIIGGATIISFGNVIQSALEYNILIVMFRVAIFLEMCTIAGIVVWLVLESNQKKYYIEQNILKEETMHTQQEYYKTIYEKDKEMRNFRHDVASQLGLLRVLLERGEVEKAKEQLESIHDEFEQASFQKIYVGDEMLDAILSLMSKKAIEKGIRLEVLGKLENEKNYDSYELCAIFSNAIRNALEACEELSSKGPIRIKLLEHSNSLGCTFTNPATEEMYQRALKGETSKTDISRHGLGVGNIRRAVERLDGQMEYRFEDGMITLEIFI